MKENLIQQLKHRHEQDLGECRASKDFECQTIVQKIRS
jgi:hypothetical protein